MSGTHLFYNGVLLRDCELREFDQVIERDESQTDVLFNRFRITVSSMLVSLHSTDAEQVPQVPPVGSNPLDRQHLSTIAIQEVPGESVVDRIAFVQRKLQQNRKDFWFALNAVTNRPLASNQPSADTPSDTDANNDSYRVVLAATGIDDFAEYDFESQGRIVSGKISGPTSTDVDIDRDKVIDADGGPKPQSVRVERISGGRTMQVVFTIEVCRRLCPESSGEPSIHPIRDADKVVGVISNRWSLEETMDENWETTHVLSGTLRVADQRYKPHAMRLVVTPALFPYARVTRREFGVDKTGLVLQYNLQITENGYAPPPGVIHWQGTYTESTTIANAMRLGDLTVTVRGRHKNEPNVDRRTPLLIALHKIAISRIAGLNIVAPFNNEGEANEKVPGVSVIQKISITEQLGKPEFTLRATVRHVDADLSQWKIRVSQMGEPMEIRDYDSRYWPVPEPYPWDSQSDPQDPLDLGSYFNQYCQQPCSDWHSMPRGFTPDPTASRDYSISTSGFQATVLGDVDPAVGLNHLPSVQGTDHSWSDEQLSDTTYYNWEGDDTYETSPGFMQLALSKLRPFTPEVEGVSNSIPAHTAAVFQVHAGVSQRRLTLMATRMNKDPEIPRPDQQLIGANGLIETLLDHRIMVPNLQLQSDGVTTVHSIKVECLYALNRPLLNSGYSSDKYRRPSSPMDLSSPTTVRLDPVTIQTVDRIEVG